MTTIRSVGPSETGGDAEVLIGRPHLRQLLDRIATAPHAPLLLAVTGPGGSGKSLVLNAIRSAYRDAGDTPGAEVDPAPVVLVDDAHALTPADFAKVVALAEGPDARLVVAYRGWPHGPRLLDLEHTMRDCGTVVELGALDWSQVAALASRRLGRAAPSPLVDHVLRATSGNARLVDQVLAGLIGTGSLSVSARPTMPLPWQLVAQLDADLGDADSALRGVVLALALGAGADAGTLAPVLGLAPEQVGDLLAQARATGLLLPDGTVVPVARQALLAGTTADRSASVLTSAIAVERGRGASAVEVANRVGGVRIKAPALASLLEQAAGEVRDTDPCQAGTYYVKAIEAGAPPLSLAARRAECAALAGDLDAALRLADEVLSQPRSAETTLAIRVAASALAHRGLLARSAELYGWLADAEGAAAAPLEPLARLGTGQLERIAALSSTPSSGTSPSSAASSPATAPPTLLAGAEGLMVRGLRESMRGDGALALPVLSQACALLRSNGPSTLLPDTPAALAALVALSSGESAHAESVLEEALASALGGPVARPRHLLLLAWSAMLRGHFDEARARIALALRSTGDLEPRDELFHQALQVGIARRANDLATLVRAWPAARETVLRQPVDLFMLLPLGEISVAAARLDESHQVVPHLTEATDLLARSGDPVLWATPMHWYGVHAAILAERPGELEPHATALVEAARTSRYAALLAEAGKVWVQVLAGRIDPVAVERAGRRMHDAGLGWDGSRLASHAAARTTDHKAMVALMQVARHLHKAAPGVSPQTEPVPTVRVVAPEPVDTSMRLSERELEVARLVLTGHTYREISERLYISAKTVEHHVARMRQRLGMGSRAELLAHLRAALTSQPVS